MAYRVIVSRGVVSLVMCGLLMSACGTNSSSNPGGAASSSERNPGQLIAPVTLPLTELPGRTVELRVGQVLNILVGNDPVDGFTGDISDPAVATFVSGHDDGSAQFNPGVTAVGPGTARVTVTTRSTGRAAAVFTVVVERR